MNDSNKIKEHLEDHQNYPANKEELMETCNKLSDVSEEEKKIMEKLPEKTYKSAREVMQATSMVK